MRAKRIQYQRSTRSAAGFTLAEMLIAVGITGILAAGTLALMFTNFAATEYQAQNRGQTVRHAVLTQRLGADARNIASVLHLDSRLALFWKGDLNLDGEVNLSELLGWSWDSDAQLLSVYTAVDNIDAIHDTIFFVDTDWVTEIEPLLGNSQLPCIYTVPNLDNFNVETIGGSSDRPGLICLEAQYQEGNGSSNIHIAIAPRLSEYP